jgi:hypothetical protein
MSKLTELREKYPRYALELDLLSGRVDPQTGMAVPDYKSEPMQDTIELDVLDIMDLIEKQGHTGSSHGYLLSVLIPMLKGLPVTPLTGEEWEWGPPNSWCGSRQNKRCYHVFLEKDGTAYNTNKYAFSDDGGLSWYVNIDSHAKITFPCSGEDLETEYVYVGGEENAED